MAGFLLLLQSPLSHLACPLLLLLVGQALGELLGVGLLLHLVGVRRLVFASPEHESALHFASPDLSLVFDSGEEMQCNWTVLQYWQDLIQI